MSTVAGHVIETLNGWAALTQDKALLGYYPTRTEAETAVRNFATLPPIPTTALIPEKEATK